jgi:peptidyl-prolyl cis-trans isomerase C
MNISVNGIEITKAAISAEVQNHPAPSYEAAERSAAEALVVRELLLQEAGRQGLEPTPERLDEGRRETDEEALIRQLLEQEVSTPHADEAACRRFYENNLKRFRTPDLYEASHIFFPASPDEQEAYAEARRCAAVAIERLEARPDRFAELARAESACSSAGEGGSLGQFARGATVPEFETFLDHLEPGQVSPVPVPTRYGYHVVRLDRREPGEQLPFEAVRERIASYLMAQSWSRGVSQYLQLLAGAAKIEGIDLDAAESPLVQ